MTHLTFEDYKNRISIQDVLRDAGYHFYRRDGLRWPCYYRLDNEGRRISGDKYIVCANGMACFQPPQNRRYNIITFIAEHPDYYPEGHAGKAPYDVVNEVCRRLLNMPKEDRRPILGPKKQENPFSLSAYKCDYWKDDNRPLFDKYFKPRGITPQTQEVFCGTFMLTTLQGKTTPHQNLSFAMRHPATGTIVGLEQRGLPDASGKSSYKGMARGTNATDGIWLACPVLGKDTCKMLDKIKNVYWFESAYDAMAFHQLHIDNTKLIPDTARRQSLADEYNTALYVSTGGTPSMQQIKGVLAKTPTAAHHACFDNDRAGHLFAIHLLLARARHDFQATLLDNGQLQVLDRTQDKKFILNIQPFEFDRLAHVLGLGNPDIRDYLTTMHDKSDPLSGHFDHLPPRTLAASYYQKIYNLEERHSSGELYWGVPPDEHEDVTRRYRQVMSQLVKGLGDTLRDDIQAYTHNDSCIDNPIPPNGCKDWNDVIMGKRRYEEKDTISTLGADGDVYTQDIPQDHEEKAHTLDDDPPAIHHHRR